MTTDRLLAWMASSGSDPLPLGTTVEPYGFVSAVVSQHEGDGERYYMLTNADGDVALMPADDIERMVVEREADPKEPE